MRVRRTTVLPASGRRRRRTAATRLALRKTVRSPTKAPSVDGTFPVLRRARTQRGPRTRISPDGIASPSRARSRVAAATTATLATRDRVMFRVLRLRRVPREASETGQFRVRPSLTRAAVTPATIAPSVHRAVRSPRTAEASVGTRPRRAARYRTTAVAAAANTTARNPIARRRATEAGVTVGRLTLNRRVDIPARLSI